jgi:hypothetical protein
LSKPQTFRFPVTQPKKDPTPAEARNALAQGIARVQQLTQGKPERQQKLALQQFYKQEPIQRLQRIVTNSETRQGAGRARSLLGAANPVLGAVSRAVPDRVLGALDRALVESSTIGMADRLMAAARGGGDARLEGQRAETRAVRAEAPVAAFVGDVLGGTVAGGTGVAAVRGAGRLAARVAPAVGQTINRAAQGVTTLREGQKGANVAKVALGGGTFGGLDAAGRGEDVPFGAIVGAVAGPVVLGGLRLGQFVGQKAGDIFGMTGGPQALRRLITEPVEDIQRRVAQARANGVEPTLFEVLSATDRRKLADKVVARSDETRETAQTAVAARGASIAPAMREVTQNATGAQRRQIVGQIEQDIAASQGGQMPPDATALAQGAARAPQNVRPLAAQEAEGFMAPVADLPTGATTVEDFYVVGFNRRADDTIEQTNPNPEIDALIRRAFGVRASKSADSGPITVGEAARALSRLRAQFGDPNIGDIARDAAEHLEALMARGNPQVAEALEASRRAFFNRASMGEGMAEGGRTRLFDDIPDTGPAARQDVANAYGTDWGNRGRALGQQNRLDAEFSGTPDEALRRTEQIAESQRVQGALAQNLGDQPAAAITGAAQQQQQGMQNIAEAARVSVDAPQDTLPMVGRAVLALSPSALPGTKIWGLSWLANAVGMPERSARQIVDRVFSQDPRVVGQTLSYLRDRTDFGEAFMRDLLTTLTGAQQGARVAGFMDTPQGSLDAPALAEAPAPDMAPEMAGEVAAEPVDGEAIEIPEFSNGAEVVSFLWPEARITDHLRDPSSPLGRKNPFSAHINSVNAVDVAPIEGVSFQEFVQSFEDAGFLVKYARDEANNPTGHATGPHWHIELM